MCGANVTHDNSSGESTLDALESTRVPALNLLDVSCSPTAADELIGGFFAAWLGGPTAEERNATKVSQALTVPLGTISSSMPVTTECAAARLLGAALLFARLAERGACCARRASFTETPVLQIYTVVEFSLPQSTNFPFGASDAFSLEPVLMCPRNSDTGAMVSMRKSRRRESFVETKNQFSLIGIRSSPRTRVLCRVMLRRARTSSRVTS
mmetsp:Transcript_3319/g.9159  ORF Transcript_3319/g.9159 Transcript_3319/m.9159 type:complete len:211 (-) Transcript_3319:1456-2088(-)